MATTAKINLRQEDPIQGHDVIVKAVGYGGDRKEGGDGAAKDEVFQNAFTDIMFKVVNQTETYLSMTSRVPRYLDGEVIIVWSATAGTLSLQFVRQTFGSMFANGLKGGRSTRIKRSNRFDLSFAVSTGETNSTEAGFYNSELAGTRASNVFRRMTLKMCRCDTLSFGVQSGKGYAVNSWQGTAEGIKREQAPEIKDGFDDPAPAA